MAHLLVQAAHRTNSVVAVDELDEGTWVVQFEGGAQCGVEFAATPYRLVLTAPIGTVPESHRNHVHRTALHFNLLWQPTGGARIGLDHDDDTLMLMREVSVELLQLEALEVYLERFEDLRAWWLRFIQTPPGSRGREAVRVELASLLA